LKKVETLLPPQMFVRVHRSYIVSTKYIDRVEGNQIHIGDKKIPIGKSYRNSFMKLIF